MDDDNAKRVLVCPLGWGLGHASRLIPIINLLQDAGCKVIIAGDSTQVSLLSSRFPSIETINFPSLRVKLSKSESQLFPLLGIAFRIPLWTIREHNALKRIIKEKRIDLIISDNRYGLWCKGTKSVLITHQLKVIFPKPFRFLEPLGGLFVRLISKKYNHCFVPDFKEQDNLAGELSHPYRKPSNLIYIGLLSRFNGIKLNINIPEWDLLGIASGPSPQREIFIEQIEKLSKCYSLKTLIIKGTPEEGTGISTQNNIFYAGHLGDDDFVKAINTSKFLITRSGYSTIMDLVSLGVRGLIVPTPGQTEQEYLAEYLSGKGIFNSCKQSDLENIDISVAQLIKVNSNFPINIFEGVFQKILLKKKLMNRISLSLFT